MTTEGRVFRHQDNGQLLAVLAASWPSGHTLWRWFSRSSRSLEDLPLFDLVERSETVDDVVDWVIMGVRVNLWLSGRGALGDWMPRPYDRTGSLEVETLAIAMGELKWFLEQVGLTMEPGVSTPDRLRYILAEFAQAIPRPGQLLEVDPAELEAYYLLGDTHPLLWPTSRFLPWAEERWP